MPQPNIRGQLVAAPLQNISIMYRNPDYIGSRIFPNLPLDDPKALIAQFERGAWFRDEAQHRAPGAQAVRGGYTLKYDKVNTVEYAIAQEVTDEDRRSAQSRNAPPLTPDQTAITYCADRIDLKKEIMVADAVKSTVWLDGNAQGEDAEGGWGASTGNTIFEDINKAKEAILATTGYTPNTLVMDYKTYLALGNCQEMLDRIIHTQRGIFTAELMASVLGVNEILIGRAVYSAQKEKIPDTGLPLSKIWEINADKGMAFLFYRSPNIQLEMVSAGLIPQLRYTGGGVRRTTVWREDAKHQDVYEVAEEFEVKTVCPDAGWLWKDTYAT